MHSNSLNDASGEGNDGTDVTSLLNPETLKTRRRRDAPVDSAAKEKTVDNEKAPQFPDAQGVSSVDFFSKSRVNLIFA